MARIFELFTWRKLYFCLTFLLTYVYATHVVLYNRSEDFYKSISKKDHFVLFYTSWCGHCLRVKPVFEKLAEIYNHGSNEVILAKVDCDNSLSLCSDLNIIRYPTLQFFWAGHEEIFTFKGKKSFVALFLFLEKMLKAEHPLPKPRALMTQTPYDQSGPFELTSSDFQSVISLPRYNFVKFYVPWCSHCQAMTAVWKHLRGDYANSEDINIAEVDCTKYNKICESQAIRGYPSLVVFKNGEIISQYYGERDYDAMKNYIRFVINDNDEKVTNGVDSMQHENPTAVDRGERPFDNEFDLTFENFKDETKHRVHFVLFFTTSCNFCKSIKEDWIELRKTFVNSNSVAVSQVSCLTQSNLCNEEKVTSYPSIFVYIEGKKVSEYQGEASLSKLKEYVESFITNEQSESKQGKDSEASRRASADKSEL